MTYRVTRAHSKLMHLGGIGDTAFMVYNIMVQGGTKVGIQFNNSIIYVELLHQHQW